MSRNPPNCDRVLAAGAVIRDGEGRVLLVKRGHEPHRGRWSTPGGHVESDETVAEAAIPKLTAGLALRSHKRDVTW